MKNFFLIVMLVSSLFSCKTDTKTKTSSTKIPKLKVIINARVLVDDVFEVYFYEPGSETFHPQDFVFTKIKGNTFNQEIIFILPDNIYPERLRLDLGKNKSQKEIKLNSVKLAYGNKDYLFNNYELMNEFKPSKYIDFDKENLIVTTKEIEGKYDPYFYSKKVINIVNYLLED